MTIGARRELCDGETGVSMTPYGAELLHEPEPAEDQLSANLIER